jgi:DNA-binding NarL/FixJ family response regulator
MVSTNGAPDAMPARARLLLVDDHTLFRTGLRLLLADSPSVTTIVESGAVLDAVRDHATTEIDLILLDIQMPGLNGIEGIKVLRRHFPGARIVIVSGTSAQDALPAAVLDEIAGFLPKSADVQQIECAIASCVQGGTYFAGDTDPATRSPLQVRRYQPSSLTPRQLEVLGQLSQGCSNKVIAHHLGLSENTVRVHVSAILDQLGVVSRVEAVLEAQRRGLVRTGR